MTVSVGSGGPQKTGLSKEEVLSGGGLAPIRGAYRA